MGNGLKRLIQNEPTGLVSLVRYAILIGIAYGLKTNDDQLALILGFVELALFLANRAMVTPVTKVNDKVDAEIEKALTAEADDWTPEQRELVNDLRAIRDSLRMQARQRG